MIFPHHGVLGILLSNSSQYDGDNADIDPFDADVDSFESRDADTSRMTATSLSVTGSGGTLSMRNVSVPSVPYTSPSAQELARTLAGSTAATDTTTRAPADDVGLKKIGDDSSAFAGSSAAHSIVGNAVSPPPLIVPTPVAAALPRAMPEQPFAMPPIVPKVAPITQRPASTNDDSTDDLDALLAGSGSSVSNQARPTMAAIPSTSSSVRPAMAFAPKPALSSNNDDDDDLDALLGD